MKTAGYNEAFIQDVIKSCTCPVCYGELNISENHIDCGNCNRHFPVINGIPNLLSENSLSKKIHKLSDKYDKCCEKHSGSPKSCGYTGNTAYISRFNLINRWLDIEQVKEKKILDIGCGTGLMSAQWVEKNEIWGIDISPGLLNIAQAKGIKTILASANSLPFNEMNFDIVLCIGVIPYYKNPEKIFSEICRVTRPNGKMIITSTANSVLIRFVRFFKNILGFPSQLAHLYTEKEIEGYLKPMGANILDTCTGYKDRICSTRDSHPPLYFKLFSLSTAVFAIIPKE